MLVLQTHCSLEGVCLSPGGLGDGAPGCVCCRDESVTMMSWGCELGETQWEGLGSGLGRVGSFHSQLSFSPGRAAG